jgi:hypothetical protein
VLPFTGSKIETSTPSIWIECGPVSQRSAARTLSSSAERATRTGRTSPPRGTAKRPILTIGVTAEAGGQEVARCQRLDATIAARVWIRVLRRKHSRPQLYWAEAFLPPTAAALSAPMTTQAAFGLFA